MGYLTYAARDAIGRKLVVPGIYPDSGAPKRKFPNHGIKFSRSAIENFLKSHLGISEEVRSQRDREFKNLTHDLRAISTEIYHSALTAKDEAEHRGAESVVPHLYNVMAAQQMMSLRLDIVDYESGHAAGRPKENIPVFKKVDKVLKCFGNKMDLLHLRRKIEGNSFGFTFGPPIFEIIPFVILENAVKYAPYGTEIAVRFEDKEEEIVIRFDSLGPRIRDSEKDRIFEQNFRGDAAKNSARSGSGIGLYAAKTLVETHFAGQIFVNQLGPGHVLDGAEFWSTRFTVIVPRLSEAEVRRGNSRRR
jgi:K+-sensing histidine kinase KdpD